MTLRTLLLATYHFPPSGASGSFRLLGFAKHLLVHGWRTVVVAPPRMPFEPVDDRLMCQVPLETVIYPALYPQSNRLTRRLVSHGIWLPAAAEACARAVAAEKPDAMLTSSPPHVVHLLGRWLKARYRLPWVVDYRDPWMHGLGKPRPRSWPARWEGLKEMLVLRAADAIVVNTPLARAALQNDIPELAGKITSITNGFDPDNFPPSATVATETTTLNILHTGELYAGRDPRPFFDALRGLKLPPGTKPLQVTFVGQASDPRFDWPAEARQRGLAGVVQFAGQVPYSQALSRMQAADILLLLDSPDRRVGIPAKLFEYFGARRPVLALSAPEGDAGWALRQSGVLYRCAVPTNVGQIHQALTELIEEVTRQGSGVLQPLPEQFTRSHMAAELAGILDRIINRRTRRAGWHAFPDPSNGMRTQDQHGESMEAKSH